MPSLDAYQNVQLTDQDAIETWLCAHWFRHQSYSYAANLQGVAPPPYDFSAYPDDDWFSRHSSAHLVLQPFQSPDQSIDLTILSNYTWDNQDDFTTWMQMHTLIHRRLDEGFGIFG
jgi:hypothetical protein